MGALLLRPAEAAKMLSISRSKVYELINEGRIPYIIIGRSKRIAVNDLIEFINKNRQSRDGE